MKDHHHILSKPTTNHNLPILKIYLADENLRELSCKEAWEAIENFTQGQKEWDNPPNIISKQKVANLKAQAKRLFGNKNVWFEMHRGIAWDKVKNPNPQSTPQVLPSFEEYTPPVTYPEKVEETLGTPIEDITYIIACRKFFKENEKKIFTVAGNGVRIYPDGVVISDKKKLGNS
nr:ribonuclease H-like domain-containing protein [Tanacetum cinerariifolium]GEV89158.1 ribonuclease H-like domain-containing protein [Tanacetum cinerariifolium]